MNKFLDSLKKIGFRNEKTKDFIAGVLALFFLIAAGAIAINKFNSSLDINKLGTGGENGDVTTNEMDGTNTSKRPEMNGTETVAGTNDTRWVANDYTQGEIKSGSYTVVAGDTLWEIAEAVYGDGTQWTRILEANKGSIGFLPNGSQALIEIGQTLQLP
uniref:LysM peptidoglycan-binding domain-containing protein n=1 Tax=candidate division WWE3 bacterium TaxID=2053526 RepID=A0A7C4XTK0_UNCKA